MTHLPYQIGCVTVTERRFAARGEFRVRTGDRVEPDTVVGIEPAPAEPIIFDVAGTLRRPPSEAAQGLAVKIGERVTRGAVIARFAGSRGAPRECRSPENGVLASYDGSSGLATLLPGGGQSDLKAGVSGVVKDVVDGRSVTIETPGAFVSGVWGVGGDVHGVLRVAGQGRAEPVAAESLDGRFTYSILVVGGSVSVEMLARCAELEVRAIIAGGIAPSALGEYLGGAMPLPETLRRLQFSPKKAGGNTPPALMLLEGFDAGGMAEEAWQVLTACNGRECSLFAPGWPVRPRLIVQLPRHEVPDPLPLREAQVAPGSTVRIIGGSDAGTTAKVVQYPAHRVALPSRVPVDSALVRVAGGVEKMVPVLNLRVIANP